MTITDAIERLTELVATEHFMGLCDFLLFDYWPARPWRLERFGCNGLKRLRRVENLSLVEFTTDGRSECRPLSLWGLGMLLTH